MVIDEMLFRRETPCLTLTALIISDCFLVGFNEIVIQISWVSCVVSSLSLSSPMKTAHFPVICTENSDFCLILLHLLWPQQPFVFFVFYSSPPFFSLLLFHKLFLYRIR